MHEAGLAGLDVLAAADLAAADLAGGAAAGLVPPGFCGVAGAYLLAHLACRTLAWKTPSRPYEPSASAWESSLKVSGGASVPV